MEQVYHAGYLWFIPPDSILLSALGGYVYGLHQEDAGLSGLYLAGDLREEGE